MPQARFRHSFVPAAEKRHDWPPGMSLSCSSTGSTVIMAAGVKVNAEPHSGGDRWILTGRPVMSTSRSSIGRRGFLKTAAKASALLAVPLVVPAAYSGEMAPWPERADHGRRHRHRQPRHLRPGLLPGAAGRAVRGRLRREEGAPRGRQEDGRLAKYGNQDCATYRDFRELLARDRHRRRADRHRPELARHGRHATRPRPARTCIARSPARRTSPRA